MEDEEYNNNNNNTSSILPISSNGDRLTETLRRMTRSNRAAVLRTIVQHLDTSDAHFLLELVKRKLSFDPLSELPVELQFKVLARVIEPVTLLRMATVCRSWRRRVLGDIQLWRYQMKRQALSRSAQSLLGPKVENCLQALEWESILKRNWQNALPTWRVTIAAHGASVITCLQLDEASGRLISGADNGSVGVWDLETGTCQMILTGHQGGVWALRATKDGLLVTGSTDRTLIVWDLITGQRRYDLIGHSSTVRCVEVIGRYIISGSRDGTLRVWDRQGGQCLHILAGHTGSVRCITAFQDRYIVSGSYDHTLKVWDLIEGNCIATLGGHDGKVYAVTSSKEYIFSGGLDAKIRVWRPLTGECIAVFSDHGALVGLLQINGDLLVAGSTDGSISLWNVKTLKRLRFIEMAHRSSVTALDLNGYSVLSGSERALRLWSLTDLASDEPPEALNLSDKTDVVWRIATGETMAAIAYQQTGITRIDLLNYAPDHP